MPTPDSAKQGLAKREKGVVGDHHLTTSPTGGATETTTTDAGEKTRKK